MSLESRRQLWRLAFGDPDSFMDGFFSTGYRPENTHALYVGDALAAALYWLDCEYAGQSLAYIYAVATHPDFRWQGLCRRLMEETHDILRSRGYAGSLLSPAGEGLRTMYGTMGYRDCCTHREFTAVAADGGCALRPLSPEEYGLLRRGMLPRDGVLQEGANLDFLSTFCRFYAGEGILLTAVTEQENLFCPEFLGDTALAPQVLGALGCKEGTFRCPGGDVPFAMFHPLGENVSAPGYLGFGFD